MHLMGKHDEHAIKLKGDAESLQALAEAIREVRDVREILLRKPTLEELSP